jgi:hypothetical protein
MMALAKVKGTVKTPKKMDDPPPSFPLDPQKI